MDSFLSKYDSAKKGFEGKSANPERDAAEQRAALSGGSSKPRRERRQHSSSRSPGLPQQPSSAAGSHNTELPKQVAGFPGPTGLTQGQVLAGHNAYENQRPSLPSSTATGSAQQEPPNQQQRPQYEHFLSMLNQHQRAQVGSSQPQQAQQIIIVQQTPGSNSASSAASGPTASVQGQPVSIGSLTPSAIHNMVSGGQALSLSGLNAQQLAAILHAYGVLGGTGGSGGSSTGQAAQAPSVQQSPAEQAPSSHPAQQSASPSTNIIVVSTNNNASTSAAPGGQSHTGVNQMAGSGTATSGLAEQIQKLQVQNQMMHHQILANFSAGLGSQPSPSSDAAMSTSAQFPGNNSAASLSKLPLSDHDLSLLQNLRTHQLHQQQKQQLQQAQINMLQRQINMMKTASVTTGGTYDNRLSQAQAIQHHLQQELLHGNSQQLLGSVVSSATLEGSGARRAPASEQPFTFQGGGWIQGVLNQVSEGGLLSDGTHLHPSQSNSKRNVAPRSRINFESSRQNQVADGGGSAAKVAAMQSVATGVGGAGGMHLGQRHSSAQPQHYQNTGLKQMKKKKSTNQEAAGSSAPHNTETEGKPATTKKSSKKCKDDGGLQACDPRPSGAGASGPYQTQQTTKKKAAALQNNAGVGPQSDKSSAALRAQYQSATQRQKSQLDSGASQSQYGNTGTSNQIKNSHSPAFPPRANKTQSNFHAGGKEPNKEDNDKGKGGQGKSKSKKSKKIQQMMMAAEQDTEKNAKQSQAPAQAATGKNSQAQGGAIGASGMNRQSIGGNPNANHHRNESGANHSPVKYAKGHDRNQEALQLPPAGPQPPVLTAKEKKKLKMEAEREREKELFELNFQASSLYISKMQLHVQKSFVTKPNAIIVYDQHRLVKLDITHSTDFQISAVPQSAAPSVAGPQKPLLITPEELHDFYNHSKIRNYANVGRALEVVEEPKHIFEKDQKIMNLKQHSIQERKIKEVLEEQLKERAERLDPKTLAKNPIIFPSANIKESTIFFNSRFESGNLREVEKLNEFEYNLYVNFDFNSSTHSQWYYFSVRNIGKGKQYKFNIMNLQKDESCYQIGMKPFVYSTKRNRENGTNQWKRGCENVCYYKNKLRTKVRECAPDYEFDEDNIPCYEYEDVQSQMVTLNTLSFCYEFEYENDITYFAYFQPYTLHDLEDYLFLIQKKYEAEHLRNIYKCEKLCDTGGGNPCYVLTITDNVNEDDIVIDEAIDNLERAEGGGDGGKGGHAGAATGHPGSKDFGSAGSGVGTGGASSRVPHRGDGGDDDGNDHSLLSGFQQAARNNKDFDPYNHQKQTIFLTGRVHPGESNASFMIQGAIDFLLQQNNKEAKLLRETFIFKIVPMLNPDGVVNGHYRCNFVGADLNRRWPNPSKLLHPTIYYTKKLLKMCHLDNQVLLFCDFHGHTRKRNVFMYGCVSPQTEINQHKNNNLIRIVPYLLDQKNKLFSFADCKFANEKEKESTGRLVMFKEFGILNSYTLESTFYSYYNPRMGRAKKVNVDDDLQVKVEELVEIGQDFCETLTAIISSKILKRKFIMDTTTPLGTSQPGAGGNPVTQFIMNQQQEMELKKHAEKNSLTYNQQNNVQSVIKSFINGPAQAPPYYMMGHSSQSTQPAGGPAERTQNVNKLTSSEAIAIQNLSDKRKLKKLTAEQMVRANDLNSSQFQPSQQQLQQQLKVLYAFARQPTHVHQKSHQLSSLAGSGFMAPGEQRNQGSTEKRPNNATQKNFSTESKKFEMEYKSASKKQQVASFHAHMQGTDQQLRGQRPSVAQEEYDAEQIKGMQRAERAEGDERYKDEAQQSEQQRSGRRDQYAEGAEKGGAEEDDGQSANDHAQQLRSSFEALGSSTPGFIAQGENETKQLFLAVPSEPSKHLNQSYEEPSMLEPSSHVKSSHPGCSQRSMRTLGEQKGNKDSPEKIDAFLQRQRTEKPRQPLQKLDEPHQGEAPEMPTSGPGAGQQPLPGKVFLMASGGAGMSGQRLKVQAITPQIIRADQVQLFDRKDIQNWNGQADEKPILSPQSRNQFESYKAGKLAGGQDPAQDHGTAQGGIRYIGGLDRRGASEHNVGSIGASLLHANSMATNNTQQVGCPQEGVLDQLRGSGIENSGPPIFMKADECAGVPQASTFSPALTHIDNDSASLTIHHQPTFSNEMKGKEQQYSRAYQVSRPGQLGSESGNASASGPATNAEREAFAMSASVNGSQILSEAGKEKASASTSKYGPGRHHAAESDFLVGPEQLNIIDQYINQQCDDAVHRDDAQENSLILNKGHAARQLLKKAQTSSFERHQQPIVDPVIAVQDQSDPNTLKKQMNAGQDAQIVIQEQRNHFFGAAIDPSRKAAIEASKQSVVSQVYGNMHAADNFVGSYSHYAHFQHGSGGDPNSLKNIRNMLKTSSGSAQTDANNWQLIANAKEQLYIQANSANKLRGNKNQAAGRLEHMTQTLGTKFGGTGSRHREAGVGGMDEKAHYLDHAYIEPSSGATHVRDQNAIHSAKGNLAGNPQVTGPRQQQLATPSAAQRQQPSANSSSLDNNNSYFGLREQKSKSSLSLMKRNTSNSQQKRQNSGAQAQKSGANQLQGGGASATLKSGSHSGAKEPPSSSTHVSDATPLLPGHKLDYGAQTQKVKAGLDGKHAFLNSAPVSDQHDDSLQHHQMFQNFCLPPTTVGMNIHGQEQAPQFTLEKQQRLLQRKQQAELQIIQVSQNIKNARQSYQSSNTVAHQTQQTLDGQGTGQHHALLATATNSSHQYQNMSGFKRKYGKGVANTMTMVSGERSREAQGTPYMRASDPLQSTTGELMSLKKKPSTSGNQQMTAANLHGLNNNGGNSSVLPKITKDGGSRLHQNLASQSVQQRVHQSSLPHRSIMKTSVVAAHISPQKYPPQAQFTHEIVPSQAPTFQHLAGTGKQGNVIDLQALSSGPVLSAGPSSKHASNKHSSTQLQPMNPQHQAKVANSNDLVEFAPHAVGPQLAAATLKHGAQSLGASPALGSNSGLKAFNKQSHLQGAKLAGRSAKKTAPAETHAHQLSSAIMGTGLQQSNQDLNMLSSFGGLESQGSGGIHIRNSAHLATAGCKDQVNVLRSMSGHKRGSGRGHTQGNEKQSQNAFSYTGESATGQNRNANKDLDREDVGDLALRLQLRQDEAQLPANLSLQQIAQSPGAGRAIVIDASKIVMHVKNKDARQSSAQGGEQLEGGHASGSSEQDNIASSCGQGPLRAQDGSAPRSDHKQHLEVVLKLQVEVNPK